MDRSSINIPEPENGNEILAARTKNPHSQDKPLFQAMLRVRQQRVGMRARQVAQAVPRAVTGCRWLSQCPGEAACPAFLR